MVTGWDELLEYDSMPSFPSRITVDRPERRVDCPTGPFGQSPIGLTQHLARGQVTFNERFDVRIDVARLAREFDMSVVFFGVSVAQVVELTLLGWVLLLLGVLLTGVLRRSQRGSKPGWILEQYSLPTRWLEVMKRLLSVFFTPTTPRAPPTHRFGTLQPIPVSTEVYRRPRKTRTNDRF